MWDKATFQEELIRRVRFGLRGIGPRTIPDHEFEKEGYLSFERTLPDDNRSLLERLQYGKLSAIVNLLMQRETDLGMPLFSPLLIRGGPVLIFVLFASRRSERSGLRRVVLQLLSRAHSC